jgi:hypothetical protein
MKRLLGVIGWTLAILAGVGLVTVAALLFGEADRGPERTISTQVALNTSSCSNASTTVLAQIERHVDVPVRLTRAVMLTGANGHIYVSAGVAGRGYTGPALWVIDGVFVRSANPSARRVSSWQPARDIDEVAARRSVDCLYGVASP